MPKSRLVSSRAVALYSLALVAASASCASERAAPGATRPAENSAPTGALAAPIAAPAEVATQALVEAPRAGEAAPSAAARPTAPGEGASGHGVARAHTGGGSRGRDESEQTVARDDGTARVANALTAAAVGDNDRRGNYLEFLSRHASEREDLALDMTRRVHFRVVDSRDRIVNDAQIDVFAAQDRVARGRSHADGAWDWFPSLRRGGAGVEGPMTVRVHAGELDATATFDLPATGDARDAVTVHLPGTIESRPRVLDLGFLVDVTGSMGDELRYVNREVTHIVERIEQAQPDVRVRVGAVFYRDRTDERRVERISFTTDSQSFANDMQRVVAMGGGDYPEDMNAGLDAAFNQLGWSDGNAERVLVVIADAPPQHYADEQFTWHDAIDTAAARGIRIVPVAASGADRSVEYLFRAMGAATSVPYVYLTDDSGVGAPHLAADTDRVTVERFADLLTRLVISDLQGAGMHEPGAQS